MRSFLVLGTAVTMIGCATKAPAPPPAPPSGDAVGEVTYYDRNHDGAVDFEFHDFVCCDRNWALVDTDFNGQYDVLVEWGYGLTEKAAAKPVPRHVPISPGEPPDSRW